jgi:hypothetical protein
MSMHLSFPLHCTLLIFHFRDSRLLSLCLLAFISLRMSWDQEAQEAYAKARQLGYRE